MSGAEALREVPNLGIRLRWQASAVRLLAVLVIPIGGFAVFVALGQVLPGALLLAGAIGFLAGIYAGWALLRLHWPAEQPA